MANTLHVFDYLSQRKTAAAPVCVAFGADPFLKQLAVERLRAAALGDDETPYGVYEGASAQWRDLHDELATVGLFGGGKRLVVLQDADSFVSAHRSELEDYVARPAAGATFILEVDTWASNTRLYQRIDELGLQIDCRPPEKTVGKRKALDEKRIIQWLGQRAVSAHNARLANDAGELLLELIGTQFGLLDQELAKLALFAGPGGEITESMVRDVTGGWRTKTVWELLDLAASGEAEQALRQLDLLMQSGEPPAALFGSISWSLRRFTVATRIVQRAERAGRRITLSDALLAAGFREWPKGALAAAEQQLKQLGRDRAGMLSRWLLELDLALKGTHSHGERSRFALERLILRMAKAAR